MRKILAVSVLLLCLITAIFFVGCDQTEKKELTFDNVIEGGSTTTTTDTGNSSTTDSANGTTNGTNTQTDNGSNTNQTNNDSTASTLALYSYTGAFEGKALAWIDAIAAADEEVTFSHEYNDYYQSESINSVSYKGITIENDYAANSYLTYYANSTDPEIADYTVDPFVYNGETYYLTAKTLEKIDVQQGLKVLFVQTIWAGDFSSSEVSTAKAVMFSYVGA